MIKIVGLVGLAVLGVSRRDAIPPTASFTESLREETLTTNSDSGFSSSSESQSASKGKFSLAIEVPREDGDAVDSSTQLHIKFGMFEVDKVLRDDPAYRLGVPAAKLVISRPPESGNSQVTLGTVNLRWDKARLFIKVEAQTPEVVSIAAKDFLRSAVGKIRAETSASVVFGKSKANLTVPFEGTVRRMTRGNSDQYGEVVTVALKIR